MKPHFPRKRFGQHFLTDDSVIDALIEAIDPKPSDHLIEIGPGQGVLSFPLLDYVDTLELIEIDRDLVAFLSKEKRFHIREADVLTVDFSAYSPKPLRIVGNLPYNISTPLLFHLLSFASNIQDMHFMLQKEVVDRITAAPGSKTYGRLSVMIQAYATVEALFEVPPEAFDPPPKVDSAVIRLTPLKNPLVKNHGQFEKLVRQAFSMRRKTLKNNLKGFIPEEILLQLPLDMHCRPEEISVQQFIEISQHNFIE
jgi:16S rRNA (adenine1518-N6/adenine1519-N6)-dimethyltransferase